MHICVRKKSLMLSVCVSVVFCIVLSSWSKFREYSVNLPDSTGRDCQQLSSLDTFLSHHIMAINLQQCFCACWHAGRKYWSVLETCRQNGCISVSHSEMQMPLRLFLFLNRVKYWMKEYASESTSESCLLLMTEHRYFKPNLLFIRPHSHKYELIGLRNLAHKLLQRTPMSHGYALLIKLLTQTNILFVSSGLQIVCSVLLTLEIEIWHKCCCWHQIGIWSKSSLLVSQLILNALYVKQILIN